MGMKCANCGKGVMWGHNVSHSKRRTNRAFRPNLHSTRIIIDGTAKRVRLCTKCLRMMKAEMKAREVARRMGERYIVGNNLEGSEGEKGSVDFFTEKMGRLRFSELSAQLTQMFVVRHKDEILSADDLPYWTVDFLYPEDKPTP